MALAALAELLILGDLLGIGIKSIAMEGGVFEGRTVEMVRGIEASSSAKPGRPT